MNGIRGKIPVIPGFIPNTGMYKIGIPPVVVESVVSGTAEGTTMGSTVDRLENRL